VIKNILIKTIEKVKLKEEYKSKLEELKPHPNNQKRVIHQHPRFPQNPKTFELPRKDNSKRLANERKFIHSNIRTSN